MLSIKLDTSAIRKQISDLQKQIPFATSLALNDLAFQAMRAENDAMSRIFDNPRPFTQNSSRVRKASKRNLIAIVSLKDAQAKYLTPYESGGQHETPGKGLLIPADIRLDQFGQLPNGLIKRLAERKDVFVGTVHGISGFWLRTPKLNANGKPKGGRRGVLNATRHQNTGLTLLLRFGDNKPVTKRMHYRDRVAEVVAKNGPRALELAMRKAIATAFR
ncbi:hypothetical protein AA101099_1786 [Neoasaia chiangmaiensis NBRC 101099]|uniref:Uncharacterized protein n=1 Tax=Neoasaia chiangmaiensis TaxID=320497 RepID=A0A1U9KR98_9PROT|nr:hypothetical protein [Neoasaia chiangmaiensis]AQS88259.1 hypothetical protein A0U93_10260 [Neoasaia chiangmaiensis]GBR39714.1 hypothetical protein AA101099_1786 [Neoasaia chiangmaiensis NBRC 101099]GEN14708.1 hypothetical protein NCH01_11390 [Neoasaia chiangmaiensis]